MHQHDPLRRYLADTLGEEVGMRPIEDAALPLYLGSAYDLYHASLYKTPIVLALALHEGEDLVPSRLAKDLEAIGRAVDSGPVVAVLPHLPSYQRLRMVKAGIPFIVPGRQLFLPMLLVDLREHYPRPGRRKKKTLGWAAQVVLIRHLLWRDIEDRNLASIASIAGYTPMTISNVRDELVATGVCEQQTRGRSKSLRFLPGRREVWERAGQFLRSPVGKTYAVHGPVREGYGLAAGISALSHETSLSAERVPTIAVERKALRRSMESGELAVCPLKSEAAALIEAWMYDPHLVAENKIVDPLSLYLSLRDNPDDRVAIALDELLERVPW